MTTISERVAAGAAFLDGHDPGWWREDVDRAIDLDALYLGSTRSCVLGQRCPLEVLKDYGKDAGPDDRYRAYAYALKPADGSTLTDWATSLGFVNSVYVEYPALTAEWKRLITERRAGT